jgi:hypothetical protein
MNEHRWEVFRARYTEQYCYVAVAPVDETPPAFSLEEFSTSLRTVFIEIQEGRLHNAAPLLLNTCASLIGIDNNNIPGNASKLGKKILLLTNTILTISSGLLEDDTRNPKKYAQLWDDFNICWLALCQKQKDSTQILLRTGQVLGNVLTVETMNTIGQNIIQWCDSLQPYGLVDYQLGIWEEEILDSTYRRQEN